MEVRSAIQQIALQHRRRYGYRRITAELHRRGIPVNHKRVARIMREDNLLGMQPERFVVTTNSNHKLEVYLNLASRMKLTGINQLWVADITYIRLKAEFVYLAVILDGFSRKVVGWALDQTLAIRLTMRATGASHRDSTTRTWLGASLRSRIAIRFRRIRESPYRRVHRAVLQSAALAFGAGLSISRRVRATDQSVRFGRISKRDDGVF